MLLLRRRFLRPRGTPLSQESRVKSRQSLPVVPRDAVAYREIVASLLDGREANALPLLDRPFEVESVGDWSIRVLDKIPQPRACHIKGERTGKRKPVMPQPLPEGFPEQATQPQWNI